MKQLKEFTIQFVGLKNGEHRFEYEIDKAFFEIFEYDELNDVNVTADVILNKKSTLLEFSFNIEGTVNVNCDLTNEPFNENLNGSFDLVVKFGDEFNNENEDILIIPHGEYELNIAQYIYELIVLSLPAKRIHPGVKNGTLQSDILEKLKELSPRNNEIQTSQDDETDPRWDKLKNLLTDK